MLRVTVEIVPFGCEGHKQLLEVLEIVNDGTGSASVGSYYIRNRYNSDGSLLGDTYQLPLGKHERAKGFWPLVVKALKKLKVDS